MPLSQREVVGIRDFTGTDSILASMLHAGVLIRWWSVIPRWYFEAERSSLSSTYDLSSSEGSSEVFEDFGFDQGRRLLSFEHEMSMEDCTSDAMLESVKWRCFAPRDLAA